MHPSRTSAGSVRLYGRRIMLRPLTTSDFTTYSEVRRFNNDWLIPWEPSRPPGMPDPALDRDAFGARCVSRDRDRQSGLAYAFAVFVDGMFAGEVNINNVQRGALQSCSIGYWIDQRRAGHAYVSEGVAIMLRFAFEELSLHRVEICIIPRNHRSHRVMEKLAIRNEGIAERFVEIAGIWEDHVRYGITVEEWLERRATFAADWL